MDFYDLIALLLFAAGAWLWYDSLKVREAAVAAARAACAAENLLLLDDTVAIERLGLARDGNGSVRLRRVYGFEYSHSGDDRNTGSIALLGDDVRVISLALRAVPPRHQLH